MSFWFSPTTTSPASIRLPAKRPHESPSISGGLTAEKKQRQIYEMIVADPTSEPEHLASLDWRMDPNESLADWTIVVVTNKNRDGPADKYHVHRNMMLASQSLQEILKKKPAGGQCTLVFPKEAAGFVPDFLDYCYRIKSGINQENAVALYYLSRKMGVTRLRWESRQFWESDLSLETLAHYYNSAIVYAESSLMEAVLNMCLEDEVLLQINEDSEVLSNPSPRLLAHLTQSAEPKHSEHLSTLVAAFCEQHSATINTATFQALTRSLSAVDFEAAAVLLKIASQFDDDFSNLQLLCTKSLSEHWDELDVVSPSFSSMLLSQSTEFLAMLFTQSILKAQGIQQLPVSGDEASYVQEAEKFPDNGDEESCAEQFPDNGDEESYAEQFPDNGDEEPYVTDKNNEVKED